jgi:hypothetical protein
MKIATKMHENSCFHETFGGTGSGGKRVWCGISDLESGGLRSAPESASQPVFVKQHRHLNRKNVEITPVVCDFNVSKTVGVCWLVRQACPKAAAGGWCGSIAHTKVF